VNLPSRIGQRYTCFVLVRDDEGWGGPYGQQRRPAIWECEDCGMRIKGYFLRFDGKPIRVPGYEIKNLADHHEHGHAPCARCGQQLLRRKDASPRQHPHNRCPGKNPGDKIEREFVKHMSDREYA
jgi:ribosomal protein L34E